MLDSKQEHKEDEKHDPLAALSTWAWPLINVGGGAALRYGPNAVQHAKKVAKTIMGHESVLLEGEKLRKIGKLLSSDKMKKLGKLAAAGASFGGAAYMTYHGPTLVKDSLHWVGRKVGEGVEDHLRNMNVDDHKDKIEAVGKMAGKSAAKGFGEELKEKIPGMSSASKSAPKTDFST